jgi:NADH-ubiquinone oxidoreductase chain 2
MILIIAIALTPFKGGISPILFTRLTSIVFLFSGALTYNALYIQSIGSGLSIYSGLFQVTVLSQSFDILIFILASLILIPWSNNLKYLTPKTINATPSFPLPEVVVGVGHGLVGESGSNKILSYISGPVVKEYSLIVLFSTLGSSLLLSSGNLLSMYLSIELQSFGVYILASIYRDSESATNAGLKYFLLGGLSSCLILLGSVLIYSYTGVINFEDIYSLLVSSNSDINTILQLGLILIFIGFFFKIAAAPFHNWAPDVYNDVPSIVTTWLTIMPKIAIIILAAEIITTVNLDILSSTALWPLWHPYGLPLVSINNLNLIKNLLLISSFLSLIIGTIVGLAQVKIKRLLAYSTISHVGFLLLALSINTEESLESLIFYLIQYSFTNLNLFLILLSFGYIMKKNLTNSNMPEEKSDISLISELKGQFITNPLLSLSLAISLFSMAGIPPLLGFFAKAGVLYSSTQNGYYFISIIAIIVSVISAYYYLQIIKVMHFDSNNDPANINTSSNLSVTNIHSFIIATLTLSILLFILKPSILLNSIHLMALNIFYF